MIDALKPYPAYKDSGLPWLGRVPAHWHVLPHRSLFEEIKERDHPDKQMLSVTITRGVIRHPRQAQDRRTAERTEAGHHPPRRQALRKDVPMYPELAVRELVANALIHQDFFITGTGPMVEIFADRIEITNPGLPLVATERFVDTPPRSRNEALASLMRRIGICEERGSGWDKIVFQTEAYQLPAPLAEATEEHTRVVLFSHRPLNRMDKADRVRAVYLHACLRYVSREHMTNTSVRERFGIEAQNSAAASRLIREAVEAKVVVPYDPEAAPKLMRYLPAWAATRRDERRT